MHNGVVFIKENEKLEICISKHSGMQIIKKHKDESLEINLYIIQKNTVLYIDPTENDDAVKSYYIVSGKCLNRESDCIFEAGDMIIVKNMEGILDLIMLEETHILVYANNNEAFEKFSEIARKREKILDSIQTKDHYTKEHCYRVYEYTQKMALKLGYKSDKLYDLVKASLYHDIGKIHIEDAILNKPGKLDDEEYKKMQQHVVLGKDMILESYGSSVFGIIVQHHERLDGTGYPNGLKGDEIMQEARILAICDSYDAMITDRVYKKGKSRAEAIDELKDLAGTKYDAELVDAFVEILKEE